MRRGSGAAPRQPARTGPGTGGADGRGAAPGVSYDDAGRLRLSHSGAFDLGANTNVTMLPLEKLGIVVLTNAAPTGLADAMALDFSTPPNTASRRPTGSA
ncbi:hypothetical protein ACWDYJ_26090 [Streptomyces sp. NPDC003042]